MILLNVVFTAALSLWRYSARFKSISESFKSVSFKKLCINLPQYCACFVYTCILFLHILIVTYNSMHPVCYGDCTSEMMQGKFVILNRKEKNARS